MQADLQGVTSAVHNAVGLIIILLGLGLWLMFMVRVWLRFRVMVSVFDRVT